MLLKNQLTIKNYNLQVLFHLQHGSSDQLASGCPRDIREPFIHHTWHLHIENIILYAHAFQATLETMIAA